MAKLQVKWFIAEDQKFNTGHVQVKLSTRPASRDVKWAIRHSSLQRREESQDEERYLEDISTETEFKARGLDRSPRTWTEINKTFKDGTLEFFKTSEKWGQNGGCTETGIKM